MTHGKKTPVKRRAIEDRGFVGAFIVLPESRFRSIGRKNDTATLAACVLGATAAGDVVSIANRCQSFWGEVAI